MRGRKKVKGRKIYTAFKTTMGLNTLGKIRGRDTREGSGRGLERASGKER